MQGPLTAPSRRALGQLAALALTLVIHQAGALEMGELEVRSALGEVLDARIALTPADGESFDAGCFTLMRGSGDAAAPTLGEGILTLDLTGDRPALRIRSTARVFEPAIALHLRFACTGQGVEREGRFAVLLDPKPGSQLVTDIPTIAATINARPGDTLALFASRMFPQERAARAQYLVALRAANPDFAKQGDDEALPDGAQVAMPDLRTYAKAPRKEAPAARAELASAAAAGTEPAKPERRAQAKAQAPKSAPTRLAEAKAVDSEVPARQPEPKVAAPKLAEPKVAAAKPPLAKSDTRQAEARRTAQPHSGSPFVLKLSSADVDMSRTRGIDDRMRAQLRERLLVLDADDQVAAMLSLRDSVKQLESRVVELQLKLATAPPVLANAPGAASAKAEPPKVAPTTTKAEAAKAEAAKVEATKVEAAKVETAKVEAAKVEAAKVEAAKVEAAKVAEPKAEPAKPAPAKPESKPAPTPVPARPSSLVEGVPNAWLIGGLAALVAVLATLAWWSGRRRSRNLGDASGDEPGMHTELLPAERAFDDEDELKVVPPDSRTQPAPAAAVRPALASDAGLSTRLGENSRELRRRYIEERFPEIANRNLVLDDAASVVKGARLFYEDGALPRAVELLQFCIEDNPQEVRTWLALFEIFRLERLTGEFGDLARRFHQHHGNNDYWRKVQYFGREIDPGNPLYREDTINTLETIGPAQARQLAAASFDPIAENWLDAPMDFENEVLANELRQALMAEAGLSEGDLIPNPMPALRNVEMFTVA